MIKSALRRSSVARTANANMKRVLSDYEWNHLSHRMARLDEAVPSIAQGIAHSEGTVQVLWVGADESQDNSGWLQALEKRATLHTFRNCNGDYGLELPKSKVERSVMMQRNGDALRSQLESLPDSGARLLLGQVWAHALPESVLIEARHHGWTVGIMSLDDRLPELWRGGRRGIGVPGLIGGADFVFTSARECARWYRAMGVDARYMPMAADPSLYEPRQFADRDIDVCFIGNRYGVRGKVVEDLIAAGVRVTCYGDGWPLGRIPASAIGGILCRSKIVLGIGTVGFSRKRTTQKLRDFEATMAGATYITDSSADLNSHFKEGEEFLTYNGAVDCARQIRRLLRHPDQAAQIGAAAVRRARSDHKWIDRVDGIFGYLVQGETWPFGEF